jgi:tetratricopeptide (TPR) repeat protein
VFSGLSAARSRAPIVAAVVLACIGAVAWLVPRGAPTPAAEPSSTEIAAPSVPRRLDLPRRDGLAPADDGTFAAAFERGVAAYNADDVESAADAFEEAVRLAPSEPEAHINLGLVYMRLQRPEDGLRELAAGAALEHERAARHPGRGHAKERTRPDDTIGSHDDPGRDGRR